MKILIVSAQDGLTDYFRTESPTANRVLIQYQHPLKAMDNLAELAPDIVLWSYDDFPRHWKTFYSALINEERSIRIYLVSESDLPVDELKKRDALLIEGTNQGFYGDELAKFLKQHDTFIGGNEVPVSAPQATLFFVDEDSGAFLAHDLSVGKTKITACLAPAAYQILPAGGQTVSAVLIHQKKRIPLDLQISTIDSNGNISFINRNLHDSFLNFCAGLQS